MSGPGAAPGTPGQAATPRAALVALADRGQEPEAHIEALAVLLALVERDEQGASEQPLCGDRTDGYLCPCCYKETARK